MKRSFKQRSRRERWRRQVIRMRMAYLRRERTAAAWLQQVGVPLPLVDTVRWTVRLAILGCLAYLAYRALWYLVLALGVAIFYQGRRGRHDANVYATEYRDGPQGRGVYDSNINDRVE